MIETKSSSENAAPAAKVTLRKKAPFFCRALSIDGVTLIHVSHPLTEADGTLCPEHQRAFDAKRLTLSEKPFIPPVIVDESANWRPSGRTGAIWPI